MVKRIGLLAFAFSAIVATTSTEAAFTAFIDRTAFLAAAGTTTTETFTSVTNGNYPGTLTVGTTTVFNAQGGGYLSAQQAPVFSYSPTYGTIILGAAPKVATDGLVVTSSGLNAALGSDVGVSNIGTSPIVVTFVTSVTGIHTQTILANGSGTLSFFGVVATGETVTSIRYTTTLGVNANPIVDNVTAALQPVPEPASLAMLSLGLVGFAIPAFRRRLRRAQA